jgi:DnaJ-class molecular chaperone
MFGAWVGFNALRAYAKEREEAHRWTDQEEEEEDDDDDDDLDPNVRAALEALGLTDAATWREIQATYRRLAKTYHPDVHSSRPLTALQRKNLERQFSKATDAYDCLRDFFHS